MLFWHKIAIALAIAILGIQLTDGYEKSDERNFQLTRYDYFRRTSILFALTDFIDDVVNLTSSCHNELSAFKLSVLDGSSGGIWALKMLDGSGQKLPGFLFGQNQWFGDRRICEKARRSMELLITDHHERNMHYGLLNESAPYDVDFQIIQMAHSSPWQFEAKFLPFVERTIFIGICVPRSCTDDDTLRLFRAYIESDRFAEREIYELQPKIIAIKTLTKTTLMKYTAVQVMLGIIVFTLLMAVMAAFLRKMKSIDRYGHGTWNHIRIFISCYDIQMNALHLFKIRNSKDNDDDDDKEIRIINGLRSIVAMFIIVLHIGFYCYPAITNKPFLLEFERNNSVLLVHTLVDIFFFISGFLQTYNYANNPKTIELTRKANLAGLAKLFIKRIFHRLLRLAPLYGIVILFDYILYISINDASLYSMPIRDDVLLRTHWWRCLTFTQNFLDPLQLPINWSWSLACEMQFFIIGLTMLLLDLRYPKLGMFALISLILISILSHYYFGILSGYSFNFDDFIQTIQGVYMNPCVRILPYLIGGRVGWYSIEKPRWMSAFSERLIGNFAFLLVVTMLSPLSNGKITSTSLAISMLLVTRIAFSFWYSWLIVAAVTGRRTWLTAFLELKIFQQIGPLTYTIYMINPLVIIFFTTYAAESAIHFDFALMAILFCGLTMITYFASIVFSLAFEIPYCNLSKHLLKRKGRFFG